jgi:tetratricopeptide (TPR) repeat protein
LRILISRISHRILQGQPLHSRQPTLGAGAMALILGVAITCTTTQSAEPSLSATRTIIVVSDSAEAFAGNESVGKIPSGSVLRYSEENGPWLLIPRYGGWLNREHVVALERSVAYFTDVIKREPAPQAFHHRGIAQMSMGAYEAAIADFTLAATKGLQDPGVFINRGVAQQRMKRLEEAVEDFGRAIQLDPDSARAYDNRAGALAELGRFEESLADSDAALRISPKFAEAYNNRGVTHRLKNEDQLALADYTRAIELYEGYAAAYANRGYIHKRLGDPASAMADYEKAIELDPAGAGALNDLAWLLSTSPEDSIRNGARAVELATQACALARDRNADYLDTLAAALAEQGDFAGAVAKAEAAIALAPDEAKGSIQQRLAQYQQQQPYREPLE